MPQAIPNVPVVSAVDLLAVDMPAEKRTRGKAEPKPIADKLVRQALRLDAEANAKVSGRRADVSDVENYADTKLNALDRLAEVFGTMPSWAEIIATIDDEIHSMANARTSASILRGFHKLRTEHHLTDDDLRLITGPKRLNAAMSLAKTNMPVEKLVDVLSETDDDGNPISANELRKTVNREQVKAGLRLPPLSELQQSIGYVKVDKDGNPIETPKPSLNWLVYWLYRTVNAGAVHTDESTGEITGLAEPIVKAMDAVEMLCEKCIDRIGEIRTQNAQAVKEAKAKAEKSHKAEREFQHA